MAPPKKSPAERALLEKIGLLEKENQRLAALAEKWRNEHHALYKLARRIADNAPDMIWAKDMDNRYLFANRALCDHLLMCKDPEAVVGKNDTYFAELERANGQRHTFGEICENSDDIVKAKGKAGRFVEEGFVRGRYLTLDVHKAPLIDEAGELTGTVGCGRDITREQKIRKDLAESRISQQLLMETASDFAFFRLQVSTGHPLSLKVNFLSPSAREIAGVAPSQTVDRWFQVHPNDRKRLLRAIATGYRQKKFNQRFRIFHPLSAQWRWLHVIASFAGGSTRHAYIHGIMFDITDQMRSNEALAAKGRELETRTDNLSEVNTALKVLLKKRDEDRKALEEKVLYNIKALIRPYVAKMKRSGLDTRHRAYLEILESNLDEIVSPLSRKLSFDYLGFTPTEIKVATMVKQGKKAREIARLLGISVRTVEGYRYTIRERLGIKGKKVNLRTYLLSIQ